MIDIAKTVGIEKGKAFDPDPATQAIFDDAAGDARAWLDARYEMLFSSRYFDDRRWALPGTREVLAGQQTFFADPDCYPVDDRGVAYSLAFFSPKHLGAGQFYLITITDREGRPLDGAGAYRLTVPADAPVRQYWSATIYDRSTHALIRDLPWSSRSSQSPNLEPSADGSVDIYFGPEAPSGHDSNWIPTSPRGTFEVVFRFYGPTKPLFDKAWQLPDIEKLT